MKIILCMGSGHINTMQFAVCTWLKQICAHVYFSVGVEVNLNKLNVLCFKIYVFT